MNKLFQSLLVLLFVGGLVGCNKKEWDEYYGRPEGLGAPIYQQLESRGNFKHLTALIDKAGYKEILSSTGWWTFFAPDDAAFERFYQENNIDPKKITDSLAVSIVKYSLVFNGYRKDQLSIYQTGKNSDVNIGQAFKRKTSYYDWVKNVPGSKPMVATNRNATFRRTNAVSSAVVNVSQYIDGDNNYKYIPYFTSEYFSNNQLQASDYQAFYPASVYGGFNVAGAKVTEQDIAAENGTVHVVDRVITPLRNLDQYLSTNPDYSEFKALLDSVSFLTSNAYQTDRYALASMSKDSVYVKAYNGQLAFSPNSENYQIPGVTSFQATASQKNSWTLLAPNNKAMGEYRDVLLAKYGKVFSKAPSSLLIDFINSHMWAEPLWPSKFKLSLNYQDEPASMELTDVIDKQVLSNGILYGVSKPQYANVFRTLYGVPYLDPAFYMTYMAYSYQPTNIRLSLTQPSVKHAIFVMPDAVLTAAGWRYNEGSAGVTTTPWGYKSATASSHNHGQSYRDIILRILKTGVVLDPKEELNDLSGSGIVETLNGEYIKYNNYKIQTSGTLDAGTMLNVTKTINSAVNGPAYLVDGLLTYSEKKVSEHIEKLATAYPTAYGSFWWFLKGSTAYNANSKDISGVNLGADYNYTVLIPSNQAISDAIKAGLLPGNATTGALPTANPTSQADIDKVRKFILFHIINGASIVPDGKKSDNYLTLLQTEAGDATLVEVVNAKDNMVVFDRKGRQANVINATSNQLSSRTVIHTIDNYLDYNK